MIAPFVVLPAALPITAPARAPAAAPIAVPLAVLLMLSQPKKGKVNKSAKMLNLDNVFISNVLLVLFT